MPACVRIDIKFILFYYACENSAFGIGVICDTKPQRGYLPQANTNIADTRE